MKIILKEAINFEKYKDVMNEELFEFFINIDPTKDKKYAQWIIREFFRKYKDTIDRGIKEALVGANPNDSDRKNIEVYSYPITPFTIKKLTTYYIKDMSLYRFMREDKDTLTENLERYDVLKRKNKLSPEEKNIMNIKSFTDLWDVTEKYSQILADLELETMSPDSYEKWYEDKEWLVVIPETHEAACKYGANTRWCTASRNDDSMFRTYTEDGPLIIIIEKGKNKWQIHFESNQWKDERDDEIPNRYEFVKSLPDAVTEVIYNKTGQFMFLKNYHKYLKTLANEESIAKELIGLLDGNDLLNAWACIYEVNDGRERYDYPLTENLLKLGLESYMFEHNHYEDASAYSEGYDNPWNYIKEKPDYEPDDCVDCNGTQFALPYTLTDSLYDQIDSGDNTYINERLTPEEQKYFLSLYVKKGNTYTLIRDDENINNKLKLKCKTCNGTGKESTKDAELYSEDQREKAGSIAEGQAIDYQIDEELRGFYSYSHVMDNYRKDTVEEIFEEAIKIYLENPLNYTEDFSLMAEGVIQINESNYYPPKDFEKKISNYIRNLYLKDKEQPLDKTS